MTDERAAWVALALTPGIGAARLHALVSACASASGAFTAPFAFLCSIPGIGAAAATAVKSRSPDDGAAAISATAALGGEVLVANGSGFPAVLRNIPDPPPVLFALGRLELLETPAAAVVGSRDHTRYGAEVCRAVAGTAAARGITIVSGMARGLDAIAHQAALDARGSTIGILGNGLGIVYPAANRRLYEQVGRDGLLLTEFPPGERPTAGSFPRRNRLISGLARVTVVIEAAMGSGALITAGCALDQGRDVMAVPGPITSEASAGTNSLLRDGAEPLLAPEDLLAHYPGAGSVSEAQPILLPSGTSECAASIARHLSAGPRTVDDLSRASGSPVRDVLAALSELELVGAVDQRAGRYMLVDTRPIFFAAGNRT